MSKEDKYIKELLNLVEELQKKNTELKRCCNNPSPIVLSPTPIDIFSKKMGIGNQPVSLTTPIEESKMGSPLSIGAMDARGTRRKSRHTKHKRRKRARTKRRRGKKSRRKGPKKSRR